MVTENVVRPKQIKLACYLLWGCIVLGFILYALNSGSVNAQLIINYLFFVAIWGYLIVGVGKGRNSARFLVLGLFLIGLVLAPPSWSTLHEEPITGIVSLAQVVMQTIALFLIFASTGRYWFATKGASHKVEVCSKNASLELMKAIEVENQNGASRNN